MQQDQRTIPLSIVKLLIGYFSHTNNVAEKDALDKWICADDNNMQVFEECLEITSRPAQYDPERDEEEMELRCATDLFMKHLKQTISPEEKKILDDWLSLTDENKKLFRELPQTNDMEVLYHWLLQKLREKQDSIKLN
jgi:hypothetical protein